MLTWGASGPAIQILATDGVTVTKTLYLPAPDKNGGLVFSWEHLGIEQKLADGTSVMTYRDNVKRYKPKLCVKYKHYDDLVNFCDNPNGLGIADGQTPTFDQLISIIGTYNVAQMTVSRGTGEAFFRCYVNKSIELKPNVAVVYADVSLEFTGYDAYPTQDLNSVIVPSNIGLSGLPVQLANPMTTLGDIIVGGVSGAALRMAGNITTAKYFYSSTGNGSAANAPVLSALASSDITGALTYTPANRAGDTFSGAIAVTGSVGNVQGSIYYNATNGMSMWAKTGTTYDLMFPNAAGGIGWCMPTGTSNFQCSGGGLFSNLSTFSGGINVGSGSGSAYAYINGGTGSTRNLYFQTTGVNRWMVAAGSDTESGSNTGSSFWVQALSDTGVAIDTPIQIVRAAGGNINVYRPLNVAANITGNNVYSNGNHYINASNYGLNYAFDTSGKTMTMNYGSGGTTNYGTFNIYDGKTTAMASFVGGAGITLTSTQLNVAGGDFYHSGSAIAYMGTGSTGYDLRVRGSAGSSRMVTYMTGNVGRWAILADNTAEGGSNTGSNFYINAYNDAGTYIDSPFLIARAAGGTMTVSRPASFTSSLSASSLQATSGATGIVASMIKHATNGFALTSATGSTNDFILWNPASTVALLAVATGTGIVTANKLNTATQNTWSKAQVEAQVTLTPGTTVPVDASLSSTFTLTAAQAFTLSNPTNGVAGQTILIVLKQDATGSRVITWGSAYKFPTGANKVLSTAASAIDLVSAYYDGTNWYASLNKGYA